MGTVQNKWLGPIKSSWRRPRIGALGINVNTKNTDMKESNLLTLSYGRIKRKNIQTSEGLLPASFETYQIVEAGDIIFRFTDLQNDKRSLRSALVEERGIITSAYVNFRPNPDQVNSVYFAYLMRALDLRKAFYEMGSGVRQTLKFEELASVPIPLPPLDTQRVIADYLDRETSEIDGILDKLEGIGQLLDERRTASVNVAIFENESALEYPMVPFWSLVNFINEKAPTRKFRVSLEDIESGTGTLVSGDLANYDLNGIPFERNDVLFGKLRPYLAKFYQPKTFGTAGGDIHVYRPLSHINHRFLFYLVSSSKFVDHASVNTTGVKMPRTEWASLRYFPSPLPPLNEQAQIVAYLDETTAQIDAMLAKVQELKSLLTERRSALITAAVTGQIEVS